MTDKLISSFKVCDEYRQKAVAERDELRKELT